LRSGQKKKKKKKEKKKERKKERKKTKAKTNKQTGTDEAVRLHHIETLILILLYVLVHQFDLSSFQIFPYFIIFFSHASPL